LLHRGSSALPPIAEEPERHRHRRDVPEKSGYLDQLNLLIAASGFARRRFLPLSCGWQASVISNQWQVIET